MSYINGLAQSVTVYAFDADGERVTGDAGNITCEISKDGGTSAATSDANPTQLEATDHPGAYIFNLVLAETQADVIDLAPVSSTAGVTLEPVTIRTINGLDLYLDGFVYVDPSAGNTNTVNFIDGLHDNAVSTYTAAKTIADSLGLAIKFVNGTYSSTNETFAGTIAAEPDVVFAMSSTANFNTAIVENIQRGSDQFTATDSVFKGFTSDGGLLNTILRCEFENCRITGTNVSNISGVNSFYNTYIGDSWNLNAAGTLTFVGCYANDVTFALGSVLGIIRGSLSGVMVFNTMTNASSEITLTGDMDVIINAGCTAGTITLVGTGKVVDNSAGATVNLDAFNVGGSGTIDANLVSIDSDAQSMTDLKDFVDDGYDPTSNKVTGVLLTDTVTTLSNKTGFSLSATGLDLILSTSTAFVAIAKAVWDTVLTGATFNITNSAGKRLRSVSGTILQDGTAQSGGNNSIQLAAGQVTQNGEWKRTKIITVGGTGALQEAIVTSSVASTDTLTVTPAWLVNPAVGTEYIIVPGQTHSTVRNGGYDNQTVYFKTGGDAGVEEGVNGTTTNPSGNAADTYTIMGNENLPTVKVTPGSTFVLPSDSSNKLFEGKLYTVNLNGKIISNAQFTGALIVFGTATSSTFSVFDFCGMGTLNVSPIACSNCGFTADVTFSSAGNSTIGDSAPLAGVNPSFILPNSAGASNLSFPDWTGPLQVKNMGLGGGAVLVEVSGSARLTLDASCTAGTVDVFEPATLDLGLSSGITINHFNMYGDPITQHNDAGTFGELFNNIPTSLTGIDTKTTNLPSDPASETLATSNRNTITTLGGSGPWTSAIVAGLATEAKQDTILARIGSFGATGVNTILGFFQALMRSDVSAPGSLGGTYDPAEESLEALRAQGDSAWITATGFSTLTIGDIFTGAQALATTGGVLDTVSTASNMRGTDAALLATSAPTNFGDLAITVTTGRITVGTNLDKTGYAISGTITTLDALDTALDTAHGAGSWTGETAAAIAESIIKFDCKTIEDDSIELETLFAVVYAMSHSSTQSAGFWKINKSDNTTAKFSLAITTESDPDGINKISG